MIGLRFSKNLICIHDNLCFSELVNPSPGLQTEVDINQDRCDVELGCTREEPPIIHVHKHFSLPYVI